MLAFDSPRAPRFPGRACVPRTAAFVVAAVAIAASPASRAFPNGPQVLCETYPDSALCLGHVPSCMACHTAPPALNPYGIDVVIALSSDPSYTPVYGSDYASIEASMPSFAAALPTALAAVEMGDPDGDSVPSLEEIWLGANPGDARLVPVEAEVAPGAPNDAYDVDGYDGRFAYKRASLAVCGHSPTYGELLELSLLDEVGQRAAISDLVDECLADPSGAWRTSILPRLADPAIRPIAAVNVDGVIPLADYSWDYRLFVHALTDGRDARDLLLADYHVNPAGDVVEGPQAAGGFGNAGSQLLDPAQRAGMVTTRWFFTVNTMFAELPRTAAAQAYRAYLGMDLARSEGIVPVAGEPLDVDDKGVAERACALCHTTLDPLAYAFAHYEGIAGNNTGLFREDRPARFWSDETTAALLGTPVEDASTRGVRGWAETAADSPAFARNLVELFFEALLGRPPRPDESPLVTELTLAFQDADGLAYSADALVHALVDSDAFGRP